MATKQKGKTASKKATAKPAAPAVVADDGPFYFDEKAARVVVRFFEKLLRHTKGEWAGKPFELQKWQRDALRELFGWKRKSDGKRRYRKAYFEIPRKNGKSTLASGIANYLLFADGEPGAEIYSAAADKDQASIVFDEAKTMAEESPELAKRCQVFKSSIVYPEQKSKYRVISADAHTKHGFNPHGVIMDELHTQPNRELFDVLWTAVGARSQPMFVMITTAGFDRNSICYEQHEYARQVRDGIIDDPEYFVFIAGADEKDDWTDEATWRKANPSYGVSIKPDYLRAEARRAQNTPAYQNTFRRLHLNQWTQQDARWLDYSAWTACGVDLDLSLIEGQACCGGLDLASNNDIAAFVLDFPFATGAQTNHIWLPFFWIPADNLADRMRAHRVPYDAWLRDGLMRATPGNVIDYDFIVSDITKLGQLYDVQDIAFDRWGAVKVQNDLRAAGFEMIEFGQGMQSMAPPMKELLRLVENKQLQHGRHPVLNWMADNMVVTQDAAGNVKPDKSKSRNKIDGMVAGVMSLDRATRLKPSAYETQGIRTV